MVVGEHWKISANFGLEEQEGSIMKLVKIEKERGINVDGIHTMGICFHVLQLAKGQICCCLRNGAD
jgi:hypothetical protein